MRTQLPTDITSAEEVQALFDSLAANDELWNIDDDCRDIFIGHTDQRMFTDEECEQLESLLEQCRAFVEDPMENCYAAFMKVNQHLFEQQ